MTQLTYSESFDPYHTSFRLLRLNAACHFEGSMHFDLIRVLDFYLLYPFRIQSMRLLSEDTDWRRISRTYSNLAPYGDIPEDINLFSRMEPFQRAALTSLARAEVISAIEWDKGNVQYIDTKVPTKMKLRFKELNDSMSDIVHILCAMKDRYPLLGRNGLKDRTGLLEYRYDAV